jgi:hypothetical protein
MTKHIDTKRGKRLPIVEGGEGEAEGGIVPVEAEQTPAIVTQEESASIRKQLVELKTRVESTYLEIGRLLADVRDKVTAGGKPLWKTWGFDTFDRYCEEELGFRERKGFYLLSVYKSTLEGPLTSKAVEKLGSTKALILAPLATKGIMTKDNSEEWVEKAKESTTDELRSMVKLATEESAKRAESGGKKQTAPEEIQIFRVGLYKDQWDNLQVALKKAEALTGSDKIPWLLDCVCLGFNSEAFSNKTEALDEICKRVERIFGVQIIAISAKEDEVVFGDKLAKMLVATTQKEKK